jgi:hypothetical protein
VRLWLEWNSTTTQHCTHEANEDIEDDNTCKKNGENCGWSGTQQQHSTAHTKRTKISKTTTPAKKKWRKLWLEWNSTTTQHCTHEANEDIEDDNT